MKREFFIGLFIGSIVLGLTIFVSSRAAKIVPQPATQNGSATTPVPKTSLTADEVAKHNTDTDCWLIISNKVYNATDYIALHPGGATRIIRECGRDATTEFVTRDGTGSHSQNAMSDLQALYIGDLGGEVLTQPNPTTVKQLNPQGREDEDENEDDD